MASRKVNTPWYLAILICVAAISASAQSFRVQCPTSTLTHPTAPDVEPQYTGPTQYTAGPNGYQVPVSGTVNGAIKCQQLSGGDGYATMGDGTQTYLFAFGPLSGLTDIAAGKPGTEVPSVFNQQYGGTTPLQPGDPATQSLTNYNAAVGLVPDIAHIVNIYDIAEITGTKNVVVQLNYTSGLSIGNTVTISGTGAAPAGYDGSYTVTSLGFPASAPGVTNYAFPPSYVFTFTAASTGLPDVLESSTATVSTPPVIDGHVDPRQIMDIGVMNGNMPAPLIAIDEDDELFLTLTNVGMIMRPDLFEQHTVHFHGYPNASSFYDGVPDASVAINIGGSFTYYYLAPDAGTYLYHCHITPPEHLQMGMVGQLYVRPRQDRVPSNTTLRSSLVMQQADLRTACRRPGDSASNAPSTYDSEILDVVCTNPVPAVDTGASGGKMYAYNDGDGTTAYDVEYPINIHGFDPNFHFVGMTFNPEGFADMKDKYFLLNGRSYPDTVTPGPLSTQAADGVKHFSQPLPTIINIPSGKRALLRISDLDVQEHQTLASLGIPMLVVGFNAKLLRDQEGNNMYYYTNSITLGGGESIDVILDTTGVPTGTYYLYSPNLDHLSNDAENFGGLMTEVHVN
jgi:FtsP/CotA-like multicopper oxidase with cupredoxin domain